MKTLFLKLLTSVAVALMLGLAATGGAMAQACIDNSAEIQALISAGQIISQYDAVAAAGYSADQILNFRLCQDGGGYVWIVGILSADGTAQNITVSAQ
ncbi:hypothetical protein SAMN05428969_0814 [Devosia sp. YR412]|uniref:hypothetical protein n=1 Tax=Devosia sp. YR412 TaxID=1881030 RepID=UPI0008CE9CA0|nr:hypothetical protein [Devosia sp. YR412]SEP76629.1 hypothetical protein SAMN05428969_0814 [Devosia sp. YR412]